MTRPRAGGMVRRMSLLRHVERCTRADLREFLPFRLEGQTVGWLRPAVVERLSGIEHVRRAADGVTVDPDLSGPAELDPVLDQIVARLDGLTERKPTGERIPVLARWGEAPLATMERAGAVPLGITACGVHVNGYVRRGAETLLWVGHRAADREVAPGKLDHLIAGGLPAGLSLRENLRKEAAEEAGLDAATADRAVPVGAVQYRFAKAGGLRSDLLFVYDLELPDGVSPENRDGEVDRFELWPLDRVLATVRDTDEFKFNVALVVTGFLLRHGAIDPDSEPDYAALVAGLSGVRPG